jgi:hypothetical protein
MEQERQQHRAHAQSRVHAWRQARANTKTRASPQLRDCPQNKAKEATATRGFLLPREADAAPERLSESRGLSREGMQDDENDRLIDAAVRLALARSV